MVMILILFIYQILRYICMFEVWFITLMLVWFII